MDFEKLDSQEKEASRNKKRTFKFGDYTVRSRYGVVKGRKCCGNRCRYCVYNFKWEKGCDEVNMNLVKDIEELCS